MLVQDIRLIDEFTGITQFFYQVYISSSSVHDLTYLMSAEDSTM